MISIVIPVLEEEKIIAATLNRIKSKLTLSHELIVSDGGSKDRTVEIARGIADKVVVYSGTERQTIGQGRSMGGEVATGDIIVFLDADCFIDNPNDFFGKVLLHFQNEPNLVALAPRIRVLPDQASWIDNTISWTVSMTYSILTNVLRKGSASGECQMMRRDAFHKVGGYSKTLVTGEDVDMFSKLSRIGKVRIDRSLVVFHTGRRAHAIGWPVLLFHWFLSTIWLTFFGRSFFKEWKPVR